MLSKKVLVSDIQNLTDARYFAAWFVDFVSFRFVATDELGGDMEQAKEIMDWLEGPTFIADFSAIDDPNLIEAIYSELGFAGIIHEDIDLLLQLRSTFEYVFSLQSSFDLEEVDHYIIPHASIEHMSREQMEKSFVYASDMNIEEIKNLPPGLGIILQGGSEEKPGFKSFDDLDLIFDHLAEE